MKVIVGAIVFLLATLAVSTVAVMSSHDDYQDGLT